MLRQGRSLFLGGSLVVGRFVRSDRQGGKAGLPPGEHTRTLETDRLLRESISKVWNFDKSRTLWESPTYFLFVIVTRLLRETGRYRF